MSKREKPPSATKLTKTYLFRLYPTRKQMRTLETWLGLCCEVYNAALDERKSAYRMAGVSLSYEDQCRELPGCKVVRPELAEVPSQVLQNVVKRVDLAFDAFFLRLAKGEPRAIPALNRGFAITHSPSNNMATAFTCSTVARRTGEPWCLRD
jgi:putative transposase